MSQETIKIKLDRILQHAQKNVFLLFAALFAAAAPLWVFIIYPQTQGLNDDFSYSADVSSHDNFFNNADFEYVGEQESITKFSVKSLGVTDGVLLLEKTFDVRTRDGEQIFSVNRIYGVDQFTLEHQKGFGDRDRSGYLFAPRMKGPLAQVADKGSFQYWHVNYDVPAAMEFKNEEEIYGLPTYHYEANITADQTQQLSHIPGVGKTLGIVLDVNLQTWIEPTSGALVKYEDYAEAYFYDLKTGKRLYPWNKFRNNFSDNSITNHVDLAARQKDREILFLQLFPGIALLCAVVCLIVWILRSRRNNSPSQKRTNKSISLSIAMLVTVICLTITYFTASTVNTIIQQEMHIDFDAKSNDMIEDVTHRMDIYMNVLRGLRGLFVASEDVERSEWKKYVESLDISRQFPGVQGFGFAKYYTNQEDLLKDIELIRQEGLVDFKLNPAGKRDEYSLIVFLEPYNERNMRAYGYDMLSESVRRKAMEYARDTGNVSISGKVQLVQETATDVQSGFLTYLPVYKRNASLATVANRRNALMGFVYSPFRMDNFIHATLVRRAAGLNLEIFDGQEVQEQKRMYGQVEVSPRIKNGEVLINQRTIEMGGNYWTFRITAKEQFGTDVFREIAPLLLAIAGSVIALALASLVYILNTRREKVTRLAEEITKDLAAEKARLDAMLLGIADGLVVVDVQGNIVLVNHAFEKLLQQKREDVIGKRMVEVVAMYDESGKKVPDEMRLIHLSLAEKRQRNTSIKTMYYERANGKKFPVAASTAPIQLDGETIGAIEVFRDITQEKNIDKAKSEFVSLASHQLRTPLTAIGWYTETLLSGHAGEISEKQQKYLREIDLSNKRMVELVSTLLSIARIDLGTFTVDATLVNIGEILEQGIKEQEKSIQERKLHVTIDMQKRMPKISVDPKLLWVIFQNLLSNAIKYTPESGSIEVYLGLKKSGERFGGRVNPYDAVCFSISDSGYGIPKSEQEKIFTKLYRAQNAKQKVVDGNGLGLYMVRAILSASGGDIWFVSEENKGSTFFFIFPRSGMVNESK